MADASIILNAKNHVSEVLQQVGKDMKDTEKASGSMGNAISSAGGAVKKALSGDFVGAAKDASSAWKNFAASMAANPMLGLGTAAVACVGGVLKLASAMREHAAEVKAAAKENEEFLASLDRLRNGTMTAAESIRADAAAYEEAGDTKSIERRLSLLREEADSLVELGKNYQGQIKELHDSWDVGIWEGLKGAVGAETRDERLKKLEASRDEAKADLEAIMDQIKVLEQAQTAIAENSAKAEAAAAEAAEKAAQEKADAAEKAAKAEQKAAEEARDAETKAAKEAYEKEAKEHEKLCEQKQRMEEQLADEKKRTMIKAAQEAAEAELKASKEAVSAAIEAWKNAGMEGIKIRKQQRQAEREAEREERRQQRDLERWENGARDRRAQAAHELDEARKAEAKALEDIAKAQEAAAEYQKEQDRKKQAALDAIQKATEDSRDKMENLHKALVG